MKENSIEEDIKIVENYLANSAMNEIDSNFFKNSGWETVDLEIPKSMQHILLDYKRVLKENEELKADNYELNNRISDLLDNIPVQEVKDKIEELKQEKKKYGNCLIEMYEDELVNRDIKILQELLEGRK